MDSLVLSLERLVMGANTDLEMNGAPNPGRLADELRKIFEGYPARAGNVTVRVASGDAIEIERPGGAIRVLRVASDRRSWELSATVNGSTPGQIAVLLGNL